MNTLIRNEQQQQEETNQSRIVLPSLGKRFYMPEGITTKQPERKRFNRDIILTPHSEWAKMGPHNLVVRPPSADNTNKQRAPILGFDFMDLLIGVQGCVSFSLGPRDGERTATANLRKCGEQLCKYELPELVTIPMLQEALEYLLSTDNMKHTIEKKNKTSAITLRREPVLVGGSTSPRHSIDSPENHIEIVATKSSEISPKQSSHTSRSIQIANARTVPRTRNEELDLSDNHWKTCEQQFIVMHCAQGISNDTVTTSTSFLKGKTPIYINALIQNDCIKFCTDNNGRHLVIANLAECGSKLKELHITKTLKSLRNALRSAFFASALREYSTSAELSRALWEKAPTNVCIV